MSKVQNSQFVIIIQKVQNIYNKLNLKELEKTKGRNLAINIPEILAISIYKQVNGIPTKKAVYVNLDIECSYKTLVVNMNRFAEIAAIILMTLLAINRSKKCPVKITDSTDIPVCSNRKAKKHKTMKFLADWEHTGQYYFYGLKLHMTTDIKRNVLAITFAPASVDERQIFKKANRNISGIFLTDAGYISKKLRKDKSKIMLTKPRKNMKKIATDFQNFLYDFRVRIEFNFRSLKMFYGLITSLPRSINGYLANYIYAILAFMLFEF